MDQVLRNKLDEVRAAMKMYHVRHAYAFGSVCTPFFNEKSDIDLLVSFNEMAIEDYADNYFNLLYQLQHILERDVDLLTENALKNPYFIKVINRSKTPIYE